MNQIQGHSVSLSETATKHEPPIRNPSSPGSDASLIIDIRGKTAVFAMIDEVLGLFAKGTVYTQQIPLLVSQIRINPSGVWIDIGVFCDAGLAMCKNNGFKAFKGSSCSEGKVVEIDGHSVWMVDYSKPPFLFVRD